MTSTGQMSKTIDIDQRLAEAEAAGEGVFTLTYQKAGSRTASARAFLSPDMVADIDAAIDGEDRAALMSMATTDLCRAIADLTAREDGKPTARPTTRSQWQIARENGSIPPDYPIPAP